MANIRLANVINETKFRAFESSRASKVVATVRRLVISLPCFQQQSFEQNPLCKLFSTSSVIKNDVCFLLFSFSLLSCEKKKRKKNTSITFSFLLRWPNSKSVLLHRVDKKVSQQARIDFLLIMKIFLIVTIDRDLVSLFQSSHCLRY